jgi:DNA polymerase III sliding clamp (beta) subunit (PCNA family)
MRAPKLETGQGVKAMKYSILINARLLKAVALGASSQESRYYLKGVFVEFFADHLTLTATDGHKMLCGRQVRADGGEADSAQGEAGIILPLDMIDKIKLGRKAPDYAILSFDAKGDSLQARFLELRFDSVTLSGFEIEATYPAARRVSPASISGETAAFDPEILITFSKAAKLAGVTAIPVVHHNGLNPALVSWMQAGDLPGCKGFGVAMPVRVQGEYAELPDVGWFTGQAAYRETSAEQFAAETARLKARA